MERIPMADKKQIVQLYHDMYSAMVKKDKAELEQVHDDGFVLHHMTGMQQDKETYIASILDGTLNYYEEHTEALDINVNGASAVMTSKSRVEAAVFGGGRHTWRLQLKFELIKRADGWKLTDARASTY